MARTAEYNIHGPLGNDPSAAHHFHKSLPIRRDSKRVPSDLRELYRTSEDIFDASILEQLKPLPNGISATPNLPPTPPSGHGEPADNVVLERSSEAAAFQSTPVTPVNQNSPPTPDSTPPADLKRPVPRPFLGTQPSLASTQAESFRTAREELASEDDSVNADEADHPTPRAKVLPHRNLNGVYPQIDKPIASPSPLPSRLRLALPMEDDGVNDDSMRGPHESIASQPPAVDASQDSQNVARPKRAYSPSPPRHSDKAQPIPQPKADASQKIANGIRRGPSLRDRLEAVDRNSPSASIEKFANIIGWSSAVSNGNVDKRASGASTTSTIGAMVFESAPLPKKRTTIRKVAKHDALRSASSPLPIGSGSGDFSHRLIHKKAKLCNENRYSYGSEAARSHSISSSIVVPKPEVIRVAIIPERSSSLQSSAQSSKRHSLSGSSRRDTSQKRSTSKPPSSWQRKRTLSESQSDRGRDQQPKILIPPRSSSLSAPTSRNTSRANSISSDHVRQQRKEAETDLRRTLDRMESDRIVSSLRSTGRDTEIVETPSKLRRPSGDSQINRSQLLATPGTSEWAALRPPSVLETPFSQPSFQSVSPELRDATAVNFFPHNNHSLQLIEPNIAQESLALKEVRKQGHLNDDAWSTQSPLRHPRQAPHPPAFQIVPPTPIRDSGDMLASTKLARRPSQGRSESFVTALTRGFSLRDARNRKKGQHLDGTLHPFWRPQGFWEAFEEPHPKPGEEQDMQVHNSLGIPQERIVITGPVSLVRRISQRRRQTQGRMLAKQSSSGSLARIRASHTLYKTSILGIHLPFGRFGDMRERLLLAKHRKDDERRERIRQDIRRKIGKEVVRQGDSRFLKSQDSMRATAPRH